MPTINSAPPTFNLVFPTNNSLVNSGACTFAIPAGTYTAAAWLVTANLIGSASVANWLDFDWIVLDAISGLPTFSDAFIFPSLTDGPYTAQFANMAAPELANINTNAGGSVTRYLQLNSSNAIWAGSTAENDITQFALVLVGTGTPTVNGFTANGEGETITICLQDSTGAPAPAPGGGTLFTVVTQEGTSGPGTVTISAGATCTSFIVMTTGVTLVSITSGGVTKTVLVGATPSDTITTNLCAPAGTRPNLRDAIRRKLGIIPPIDTVPGAIAGDEPFGQSWPMNSTVNQAISDALRTINRECGFHNLVNVSIPVTATTSQGVQWFSLMGVGGMVNQNVINQVKRVVWDDGSQTPYKLQARSYLDMDRNTVRLDQQAASSPRTYSIEGYRIGLVPGANVSGNLRIYACAGIVDFCSDTDILDELPIDYQEVIEDLAVVKICMMRPDQSLAPAQMQTYSQSAKAGLASIRKFYNLLSLQEQPSLNMLTRRRANRWI